MDKNTEQILSSLSSEEAVQSYVSKNLSQADKKKINDLLKDRNRLNEILSSPLARELMRKFGK